MARGLVMAFFRKKHPKLCEFDAQEDLRDWTAIDDLTAANDLAELVCVRTGFGEREWLFYAAKKSRFMAQFNALLTEHPRYPIEISSQRDPDWKIWRETRDPLLARTEDA